MRNWIRIFLVCFVLIGGTAFFVYQYLNQFNSTLDAISASSFATAKDTPVLLSDKTNKEQIPTSTTETISTSTTTSSTSSFSSSSTTPITLATSTDLNLSFIFPKKNNKVYIGCTYQLFSFQSSTAVRLLETTLIDAGNDKTVEPIISGLAKENKIEPNSLSLDWKVGSIWPGEYYIKASNINDVDLESKVFAIRKMPKGISTDEREKICKESGGSF